MNRIPGGGKDGEIIAASDASSAGASGALNDPERIGERVRAGEIGWGWPLLMTFIRFPLIVAGVVIAYAFFALGGNPDALLLSLSTTTFVITFVNAISLLLLVHLTRREGMRLRDLVGFDRARLGRDLALGALWLFVLNIPYVIAIIATLLVLTRPANPQELGAAFELVFTGAFRDADPLSAPLWLAVASAVLFPLLNPWIEEMHYRGYVQPRLEALSGRSWVGIVIMAAGFAVQHMAFAVSAPGIIVFAAGYFVWGCGAGIVYRFQRRLPSLIVAHFVINLSAGAVPLVLLLTVSAR